MNISTQIEVLPGIQAEEIDRSRLPLSQAYTLPPSAYTSDEVYEREIDRIMRRSWLPLARVDQLPKPGDYLSFDVFDQPLLVVHGQDGQIRTLSRVCLHRAAPIVDGGGNRKLFTCPYHAWSYDTTGQLIRAPMMEEAAGFTEKNCRLPQIKTEIWNGFIMINLDKDAQPFAPQVAGFERYFENIDLSQMVVARTMEFDSDWNWKVLVENFMEAYHHIATHSGTLEPIFHAQDSQVPDNDGPWSILHMPTAAGEEVSPDLFANVIFPHFLIAFHGETLTWYQVFPRSSGKLLLKIHICLPRKAMEEATFEETAQAACELTQTIHMEDIEANDLVWKGLQAPFTTQGRLAPLEKSIWQLNQWWLDKMLVEDGSAEARS